MTNHKGRGSLCLSLTDWGRTGKLVSLWDMLLLDSEKFLHLLRQLHELSGVLLISMGEGEHTLSIDKTMRGDAENLISLLGDLSLSMSLIEAKRLRRFLEDGKVEFKAARERIRALADRIHDEIGMRKLLVLSEQEAQLYSNTEPFGSEIAAKFQDAKDDIEDAAKCLSLDRGSACVFHLMCVMDVALNRFVMPLLGSYDPTWDWNTLLDKTIKPINAMPTSTREELIKKDQYLAVHADLHAVRRAWRNPTMHDRRRYMSAEARDVFNSVGAFMRDLEKVI